MWLRRITSCMALYWIRAMTFSTRDLGATMNEGTRLSTRGIDGFATIGFAASACADVSLESNYVPPSDTLEAQLIEIWEDVLGVTRIGVRDDFFQLGGHSLLAARMFARIAEKLLKNLPLATMFQAATIRDLAQVIREEGWTPHWSVLVPIREHGNKPPLFLVHGLHGNVLNFYGFRHHIPADKPLYGVQAIGLDTGRAALGSIPYMAEYYIKEIRSVQPVGPYF